MKADMFLSLVGEKRGPIKGESVDPAHPNEIELLSWSWGMRGSDTAGAASAKRSFLEFEIRKNVDSSTPALYSTLSTNESLKKVNLTVRKAGGGAQNYFTMAISKARIASIVTQSGEAEHPEVLVERVTFAFSQIDMTYRAQSADGSLGGSVTFSDAL